MPVAATLKVTDPPAQRVWLTGCVPMMVVGVTVIVNVVGEPVQVVPPLVYVGVTVIVAVTGAVVVFTAVKEGILPVPLAARPIEVVLLVQLYTVPVTAPVKLIAVVAVPLHNDWLATVFTVGIGFTVMVNVLGVPAQVEPLTKTGVTVMVAVIAALVLFVPMKEGMLPVPLAPRPIAVLLFVQLNTVPGTVVVKFTAPVGEPLQTVWFATAFTVGVGFTVMVNVIGVPVHVVPPLV